MQNTLGELLQSLVGRPLGKPSRAELEAYEGGAITFRPNPELRYYLEQKAEQLGNLPLSNFVTTVLSALKDAEAEPDKVEVSSYHDAAKQIAGRVRHLFFSHGYLFHEATAILEDYGITPSTFLDDVRLMDHLTEEAIIELSNAFCVTKKWLCDPFESEMSERPNNRHNSSQILSTILQCEKDGTLAEVIPLCKSTDLKGQQLKYQDGEGYVPVSIAIKLTPATKYKHERFIAWNTTDFAYSEARIEFKALLLTLYERYGSSPFGRCKFLGQSLDENMFNSIIYGGNVIDMQPLAYLACSWDAELYVGAEVANAQLLETHELAQVRAEAKSYQQGVLERFDKE